ncbi:LPP20 family lipoprotein [Arsukibacterium sp.]|uniref:LPP20 family lipoprotein n=1 Tax=Arsukibacterium sp. TaxID=1977258 RepID=UPI002FD97761
MNKLIPAVSLVFSLGLSGCSQLFDRHIQYETETPAAFPILTAVGFAPISAQPGDTQSQKMLLAMRASKLEAYRELAERVYGQRIDSDNTLSAMVSQHDQLSASVQGVIRGARVVKSYVIDDAYFTELELDFREVYHTVQNVQPQQRVRSVRYF